MSDVQLPYITYSPILQHVFVSGSSWKLSKQSIHSYVLLSLLYYHILQFVLVPLHAL